MNTFYSNINHDLGELSRGQVILRLITGAAMILFTLSYQGPFSAIAVVPLLAVYPVFTALIGVDPVYLLWQKYTGVRSEFSVFSRTLLLVIAAGLIGSVMGGEGELGWRGILALVAVYPVLAAIVGKDPFNAFVSYKHGNVVHLQDETTGKSTKTAKAA